jgi:hypothetical protein
VAHTPAPVVNSLLKKTADLIESRHERLAGRQLASLSLQLHWLSSQAGIDDGLGQVREQLALWTARAAASLGIDENRSDAFNRATLQKELAKNPAFEPRLLAPKDIARMIHGLVDRPAGPHGDALLKATAAHARAQLYRLGDSDDPTLAASCLLDRMQTQQIIDGMSTSRGAEAMLPVLLAHIEHPQQRGFEDLDDAPPQQLFLAEVLNSLGPHMHLKTAQAVVKALYKETGERLPALDLAQAHHRGQEIYRLLEASGHIERSEDSMKIDLHGLSHHLGETLTRLALRDPQAPDRLHIVYGDATHRPVNRGKMLAAVQTGIRKAGFDPAGLRFPPGHVIVEKSQTQGLLRLVPGPAAQGRPSQDPSLSAGRPAPAAPAWMSELPEVRAQGELTQLLGSKDVKLPVWKGPELGERRQDIKGFNDCALNAVLALDPTLQELHRNRRSSPAARKRYEDSIVELAKQMTDTRRHPQTQEVQYRIGYSGIEDSHLTRLLEKRGIDVHVMMTNEGKDALSAQLAVAHHEQERMLVATKDQPLRIGNHTIGEKHFV